MALHCTLPQRFVSFLFCLTSCQSCALSGYMSLLCTLERNRSCSEVVSFLSCTASQCASHHLGRILFCLPESVL